MMYRLFSQLCIFLFGQNIDKKLVRQNGKNQIWAKRVSPIYIEGYQNLMLSHNVYLPVWLHLARLRLKGSEQTFTTFFIVYLYRSFSH